MFISMPLLKIKQNDIPGIIVSKAAISSLWFKLGKLRVITYNPSQKRVNKFVSNLYCNEDVTLDIERSLLGAWI